MSARLSGQCAEVVEEVRDGAHKFLEKLCVIWEELGLDEESVSSRFNTFKTHTMDLYNEMIREEQSLLDKQRHKIQHLLQQLDTINIDLNMSESVNITGLGVMPAKTKLEECLKTLRVLHAEAHKQRVELANQERALCKQLGQESTPRPERFALCKEVLLQFKTHVLALQREKEKRMSAFLKTRTAIVNLYAQLEQQPANSFEQSVSNSDTEHFNLDNANLLAVEHLHTDLKDRVQQVKDDVEKLRDRLSQLWERLEIDAIEREAFHENFPGFSHRTREALQEEIERCVELKHLNIERFVLRMRDELIGLWDRCCVSQEERDNFAPYFSQDFSDELLEAHEAEVKRLEEYFEANRCVFDLLGQRAELWERLAILEQKATDPTRFSNRGGQLLKEEKERKQLQRELPQVENKLKSMISAWEQSSGEPFLLNGQRASIVLAEQWENRKNEKERGKQERKLAQQKQLQRDADMGTTMMTMGGVKRKLASATPEMTRKLARLTPAATANKAVITRPVNGSMRRPDTRRPESQRRVAARKAPPTYFNVNINVGGPVADVNDSLASAISYTEFANHLEARATRSSAVPGTVHFKASTRPVLSPLNVTLKTPQSKNSTSVRYPQSAPAKPPRNLKCTPKTPNTNKPITRTTARTAPKFTRTRTNLPIIF